MFFYTVMMLGAMYLSMLVTDWEVSGNGDATRNGRAVSFWVKNTTIWVTMLIYLWTLLAPYYCCKDRDFGFDAEEW
jgi:hypothetical protein